MLIVFNRIYYFQNVNILIHYIHNLLRIAEKVYFRNICFPSDICKVTWDGQENKKNYLAMSSISAKGINGSKNTRVDDPIF